MGWHDRHRDGCGMHPTSNPTRRLSSSSYELGAPALLLVSVAALVLMVVVIALVGVTNAGWAVAAALIAHMLTTAVVIVAVMKMLGNAGRTDT
jgi:hypothetical protein